MGVGIKIRRLREKERISQVELSAILGISQTKLCNIESSVDKAIDFNLIEKICTYFKVDFTYFLEEKQNSERIGKESKSNLQTGNPEDIITQIRLLIEEIKNKDDKISQLEKKINNLEKPK